MTRKTIFKIGLASAAAGVAAILAITSAFAHGTPTTTGRSMVGTIVNAATGATFVSFEDQAPTAVIDEQTADAEEAAELAAKLAAQRAEEAAEAAAAICTTADQTEDTSEAAADQSEDSAEKTNGTESAAEDSAEQAARQATDKPEDAAEVKCAATEGEHHSDGDSHESSTKTFSSEGDH